MTAKKNSSKQMLTTVPKKITPFSIKNLQKLLEMLFKFCY